ncbi:putative storage protein [Citrus sinensis]|nr:putative storage protein [Citrus sinensis]
MRMRKTQGSCVIAEPTYLLEAENEIFASGGLKYFYANNSFCLYILFVSSNLHSKTSVLLWLIITTFIGVLIGYFVGRSFQSVSFSKIHLPTSISTSFDIAGKEENINQISESPFSNGSSPRIYVSTNPRGAELLPPGIVVSESDFFLRRLWGEPSEDLKKKPKYLLTITVGLNQKKNIDRMVKKFSEDFQIMLFHYDGQTSQWDEFEWSKSAIHVSIRRQTKWWYAKRFLHPDVVAAYEYIFIWDEDLGVEHFNGDKYMELVKKHGLDISQPGLEPNNGLTWQMTKRRGDQENDLVHGWGLDFALRRCVEPAHEKIGVVDSQWIIHQVIPSLGSQVRARCKNEWSLFQNRLANADKAYLEEIGNR